MYIKNNKGREFNLKKVRNKIFFEGNSHFTSFYAVHSIPATKEIRFKHYTLFSEEEEISKNAIANLENADKYQQIIPRTLGFSPEVTNLPVVIVSQKEIGEILGIFGSPLSGIYDQGVLVLTEDAFVGEFSALPLLLHETSHAYLDQMIDQQVLRGWFNEGQAFYITYLGWHLIVPFESQKTYYSNPELVKKKFGKITAKKFHI